MRRAATAALSFPNNLSADPGSPEAISRVRLRPADSGDAPMSYTLTDHQGKAVRKIVNWFRNDTEAQIEFVLGGFAGTGKSTILPSIVDGVGLSPGQIAFMAPTGKAAKVMGDKLRQMGIITGCTTVHSAIYTPKPQKAEMLERDLENAIKDAQLIEAGSLAPPTGEVRSSLAELQKKIMILQKDLDRAYDLNDLRFSLNPESKLLQDDIRLIVLDEGSMVGEEMAEDLKEFEIPILVMGDPGQLPPVGDKPGFFNRDPDAFLTEVHRQAKDNPIIHIATEVRMGRRCDYGSYDGLAHIVRPKDDIYTYDLSRDAQILVGTHKKRFIVTSKLRRAAGYLSAAPQQGEPLIMCKNSKEFPSLVNGMQCFSAIDHEDLDEGASRFLLELVDEEEKHKRMFAVQSYFEAHIKRDKDYYSGDKSAVFKAKMKDHHVDFGWAITCHKSQGSQWDEVVVHDESGVFREAADQWLYTAVTRAAQSLVIVA